MSRGELWSDQLLFDEFPELGEQGSSTLWKSHLNRGESRLEALEIVEMSEHITGY